MAPRHTTGSKPPRDRQPNRRAPSGSTHPQRGKASDPPSRRGRLPTILGAAVGVLLGGGGLAAATWSSGCSRDREPPGPVTEQTASSDALGSLPEPPTVPEHADAPVVEEPDPEEDDEEEADEPWEGPWLGAMGQATPIYPTARFSKNRMGYIRRGGKVPVVDEPVKTDSCEQGFYPLVDGGYVCGKYATTNLEDPRVKMGVKKPNLDALLPYRYAYNKAHGTPLYSAVPSKEEMLRYEPYLDEAKEKADAEKAKEAAEAAKHAEEADKPRPNDDPAEEDEDDESAPAQFLEPSGEGGGSDSGGGAGGGEPEEPKQPWWQREGDDVEVEIADLDESDGTLRKRMVKGFFIAIDRTFGWNNRMWYKATDGLIAPADRMIIPKTPKLEGVEMDGDITQVGFVLWRKGRRYDWDDEDEAPERGKRLERYESFALTGKTRIHDKHRYRETVDGWWFKEKHGTYTDPEPRPDEVGEDEKWIDVNLRRRSLVAFEGDDPVFAALISPGKRSSNPAKDHRTKTGTWRIGEKHVAATMDGDGPAGELPYSIQDVPYVQYYDGSYALHGAFWHNSFGHEKSHGCVNLSPHDAKFLFFWTEPDIPRGWHGVYASDKRQGTVVHIHR